MTDLTRDTFFNGRLTILQERCGYRFSIDALLLADSVRPRPDDSLIDLGTGCGIIPLILALRHPAIRLHAIEVQASLAELARKNIIANQMEKRIVLVHDDMRAFAARTVPGGFDWVISNPPYRAPHSGRVNPEAQKALARHEIMIDLQGLILSAKRLLRTGGRFATIFPATRLVDLLFHLRAAGIEPKCLQSVHSHAGQGAKRVLVCGIKAGRAGLRWAAPLVIYHNDGIYTDPIQSMMSGQGQLSGP
jgi:tRNA1Val (adenine37-N6)-methyltransferase